MMTRFLWALLVAAVGALTVRVGGFALSEPTAVAIFTLLGSIVAMLGALGVALIGTRRKVGEASAAVQKNETVMVEIHGMVNSRLDRMEAALDVAQKSQQEAESYRRELIAAITAMGGVVPDQHPPAGRDERL